MKLAKYVALKFSGATTLITYMVSSLTKHRNGPWDRPEAWAYWESHFLGIGLSFISWSSAQWCVQGCFASLSSTQRIGRHITRGTRGAKIVEKRGQERWKQMKEQYKQTKTTWEWQRESCCHWVVSSIAKTGYRICEAQWKMKIQNHFFRNY